MYLSVSKLLYEATRRRRRCYMSTKKATRKLLMKKLQRIFAAQQMQFVFHCKEGSHRNTNSAIRMRRSKVRNDKLMYKSIKVLLILFMTFELFVKQTRTDWFYQINSVFFYSKKLITNRISSC